MSHWSALVPKSHQTFRIHPQGRHHIPRCIWCMDERRMRAAKFDQLGRITHTNGIDWHQKNRNKIYFNVFNVPHGLYREAPGKPWRRLYLHCWFFFLEMQRVVRWHSACERREVFVRRIYGDVSPWPPVPTVKHHHTKTSALPAHALPISPPSISSSSTWCGLS